MFEMNVSFYELAEAGWCYTGDKDRVKCWYCSGVLQKWNVDDDPWEEHAKCTTSRKYAYADDLTLLHSAGDWQSMERHLSQDMQTLTAISPEMEAAAQQDSVGGLPPQQQGSTA
ncbi:unnamed protein product [Clavelina lepadiformis]|uniref:Uncharacterized protein n=1 Tax=Clavelina lepadiformis TaxID=159417 RepID=A0ABP0G1N9_CLALP